MYEDRRKLMWCRMKVNKYERVSFHFHQWRAQGWGRWGGGMAPPPSSIGCFFLLNSAREFLHSFGKNETKYPAQDALKRRGSRFVWGWMFDRRTFQPHTKKNCISAYWLNLVCTLAPSFVGGKAQTTVFLLVNKKCPVLLTITSNFPFFVMKKCPLVVIEKRPFAENLKNM